MGYIFTDIQMGQAPTLSLLFVILQNVFKRFKTPNYRSFEDVETKITANVCSNFDVSMYIDICKDTAKALFVCLCLPLLFFGMEVQHER